MTERARQRQAFLDATGWGAAVQAPLAGDASNRTYVRLRRGADRAMLMDAPPDTGEDVRPFAKIARHLADLELSAPAIYAEDEDLGFLLLEDFGDATFTNLLADGADETSLYELATDTLIALHAMEAVNAAPDWLDPFDDERLLAEAALLPDWFMTAHGIAVDAARRAALDRAWVDAFRTVHAGPRTLVLRDYHVDNLMRLDGRAGVRACGLLDFQDALAGHPAYDLMSLLEDARRDVPDALQAAMVERYLDAARPVDPNSFIASYAILAAQRHAKVIGIFTRLDRRDGKARYLTHIPRVWRLFERALTHPALADVKAWVDAHIPPEKRTAPKPAPPEPAS